MGMAASQARFLGLTARKTNVEFEGQQINQQRTTLGNQSANYYNQLLGMEVPVPPSVQDFTKTVYSFQDGNLKNSITALVADRNGMFKVSYVSSWQNDFAPVANGAAIVFRTNPYDVIVKRVYNDGENDYTLTPDPLVTNRFTFNDGTTNHIVDYVTEKIYTDGQNQYTLVPDPNIPDQYSYVDAGQTAHTVVFANGIYTLDGTDDITDKVNDEQRYKLDNTTDITSRVNEVKKTTGSYVVGNAKLYPLGDTSSERYTNDAYFKTLTSQEAIDKAIDYENSLIGILQKKYGNNTTWLTRYVLDTTSGVWNPIFYQKEVVESAQYNDETGASQSNIPTYKIGSATETEEVKGVPARLEKDSSGRYINITLIQEDAQGQEIELSYSLTTNTTTDQAAYNDAMNQYEFDKYNYDQSIQEINAKIEIVQAEDRNLELRLKQLDTEQEAIQTEMEAVEKVINKNTESTFKVFG